MEFAHTYINLLPLSTHTTSETNNCNYSIRKNIILLYYRKHRRSIMVSIKRSLIGLRIQSKIKIHEKKPRHMMQSYFKKKTVRRKWKLWLDTWLSQWKGNKRLEKKKKNWKKVHTLTHCISSIYTFCASIFVDFFLRRRRREKSSIII